MTDMTIETEDALGIPHLTRKQIVLAHRLAAGDGIREASRRAGYYDHCTGIAASKNPKVQMFIAEVRRRAAVASGCTLEYVVSKHHAIIEDQSEDTAARQRSLAAIVDILDLRQVGKSSDPTRWQRLSDEDLDAELARLQNAVDATPALLNAPDPANA